MKYIYSMENGAVHVKSDANDLPLFSVVFNGSYYSFNGVRVINSSQPPANVNDAKEFFQACIAAIDYAKSFSDLPS